eukprot:evm.model.scf_634.5 EVM.evm.TU.scf_634.5   scf_634:44918-46053(-)
MSCAEGELKHISQEELNVVDTHIAPSFTTHPVTGDHYAPYNKPLAILDWISASTPQEEWLLILDGDMLLRYPFSPTELGAEKGRPLSAGYGYLKGVANRLAEKHIPDVEPRNDTEAGIRGRRADQVGGFFLIHREDLKAIAPMWLNFTQEVREDTEAWELSGDKYSTSPGSKPWISEMYGYVFAAAKAGVWHKVDRTAMLYPGMLNPADIPRLLHYGLILKVKDYSYDKHWHTMFDAFQCPNWDVKHGAVESGSLTNIGLVPKESGISDETDVFPQRPMFL